MGHGGVSSRSKRRAQPLHGRLRQNAPYSSYGLSYGLGAT